MWVLSMSSTLFHWSALIFMLVPVLLLWLCSIVWDQLSLVVTTLLSLLRTDLLICGSLHFHMNFRIYLQSWTGMQLEVHGVFSLILLLCFHSINSANPQAWEDFLCSVVFFHFFFSVLMISMQNYFTSLGKKILLLETETTAV